MTNQEVSTDASNGQSGSAGSGGKVSIRVKGTTRIVTTSRANYDSLQAGAARLLKDESGYLHARDREELEDFIRGEVRFGLPRVGGLEERAARFKKEGVPPIFLPEYETTTRQNERFPTIDYFVLHGAGTHKGRMAAQAMKKQDVARESSYLARELFTSQSGTLLTPPVTPNEVKLFASRAFDDGEVSVHFLRFLKYRLAEESFAVEESIPIYADRFPGALMHMRTALADLIPEKTVYEKKFEEGLDLHFLELSGCWTVEYSPSDREKIAREYVARLARKEVPRSGKVMTRMQYLFPEICAFDKEDAFDLQVRESARQAIARGDANALPPILFMEPSYRGVREQALEIVKAHIERALVGNEGRIMTRLYEPLAEAIGLRKSVLDTDIVTDFVHQRRLQYLEKLTDEAFASQFSGAHDYIAIGARHSKPLPHASALKAYVVERAKCTGVGGGE